MATKPDPTKNKEFKLVPAGTHLARCCQFIHIGHVPNTFPGATTAVVNKIRLTWELPDETNVFSDEKGAQPFSMSKEYTLSMNDKANLRKVIESWFGAKLSDEEAAEFDTELLVGKPALITITHTVKGDKTYADVQNVTALPKSMTCPEPINKSSILTWENMSTEDFNKLPPFLQDKMKQAAEYGPWCAKNGIAEQAF